MALACQILILREPEYLPADKSILLKHTVVAHSDPRLLVVSVANGNHCGTYIVGHAPQNTASADIRRAWWQQLRRVVAGAIYPVILCIDANGRTGFNHRQQHRPRRTPSERR